METSLRGRRADKKYPDRLDTDFEDKQVDYGIDIPEQPVRVRLDMDSYMRIINNLIQNVIAHSHADKIKNCPCQSREITWSCCWRIMVWD